jgi:sugar lactone lactonase YvrE
MRLVLRAAALIALVAGINATAAAAPRTGILPAPSSTWTLPSGAFAESMVLGQDGALYVSHTTWGETTDVGEIYRVAGGVATPYASIDVGSGLVTGLAVGPDGRLYAGVASFADDPPNGVVRIEPGGATTQVLTVPADVFPNGLAFHGGLLYVTDPANGAIWRVRPGDPSPTAPWLQDKQLAPIKALGVNGIAFRGDTMVVAQYDRGQILTASVNGGPLRVFAHDPALKTADGIAFDPSGNLWVTANGTPPSRAGPIVVVTPDGNVVVAAERVAWLDYPTQPVVAPGGLFVVNGSYDGGLPNVIGWST